LRAIPPRLTILLALSEIPFSQAVFSITPISATNDGLRPSTYLDARLRDR